MKNASFILPLVLLATVFLASVAHAAPTFEQANSAFESRNYRGAIDQYQAILAKDGFSAPVLFNLGNAFYRDGQVGNAILSYERAQILAPGDSEIAANLRLARAKGGITEPAMSAVDRITHLTSPNTLAWIGSAALTILCLAIALDRLLPRFAYARTAVAFSQLILAAVVVGFAIRWPQFDRAIVVATTAPARIAPATTAAESFVMKTGQAVAITRTYGQFSLIHTLDGRSGWVSDSDVGRVFTALPTVSRESRI